MHLWRASASKLAAIAGELVAVMGMMDDLPAELTAVTGMLVKWALTGMLVKLAKNCKDVGRSNPNECHCAAAITSATRYIFT